MESQGRAHRYADRRDVSSALIAATFARVLPSRDEIDEKCRIKGTRVTGMRRIWATLFDYLCAGILNIFVIGALRFLNPKFTGFSVYAEVDNWTFFCVMSFAQVLITKGSTLGHATCRMILVSEDGGMASRGQLIKRYLYLMLFTELPLIMAGWLMGMRFAFIVDAIIPALVFSLYARPTPSSSPKNASTRTGLENGWMTSSLNWPLTADISTKGMSPAALVHMR